MIKMIANNKADDGWFLHFEFHLFGGKPVVEDKRTYPSKESAKSYWEGSQRSVLMLNFERYIFLDNGPMTETMKKGRERLINANRYFCETQDITTHKICSMILKIQKDMLSLLSTKNENHGRNFEYLNQLIAFCKETTGKESSDASA